MDDERHIEYRRDPDRAELADEQHIYAATEGREDQRRREHQWKAAEEEIDISDRQPRNISPADIIDADSVVTMGRSIDEFCPKNGTARRRRGTVSIRVAIWRLRGPNMTNLNSESSNCSTVSNHKEGAGSTVLAAVLNGVLG